MNDLKKKLKKTESAYKAAIKKCLNQKEIEAVRLEYLSRKGHIAQLMGHLKTLSSEKRRIIGPLLNQFKDDAEKLFCDQQKKISKTSYQSIEEKFKNFDVTAYKPDQQFGSLHIYTQITDIISNIFISMGYQYADGLEVESDYYNFQALNIPQHHPARDLQDTFWVDVPGMLMRTHTSPVQIHTMQSIKPPIALFSTGRCYRHEATDSTHDTVFLQTEGLYIGENVSIGDLLGTIEQILQAFFAPHPIKIRTRPGYFPFVEPGLEVDMSCPFCSKGCSICKQTQWIEMVGSGLVHPNVLKESAINPKKYSGFAFGMGITRLAMLKYNIHDIRTFHSDNVEFLKQF